MYSLSAHYAAKKSPWHPLVRLSRIARTDSLAHRSRATNRTSDLNIPSKPSNPISVGVSQRAHPHSSSHVPFVSLPPTARYDASWCSKPLNPVSCALPRFKTRRQSGLGPRALLQGVAHRSRRPCLTAMWMRLANLVDNVDLLTQNDVHASPAMAHGMIQLCERRLGVSGGARREAMAKAHTPGITRARER